ncbi:MAG: TonB-dependent receptor, partial [Pedobacter sp.]
DELYRNAFFQRHNLAFSGGNKDIKYFVSGGYQDQDGIVTNTSMRALNFRSNIEGQVSKKLKVGANISLTQTNNKEVGEGRFSPMMSALLYLPYLPANDANGNPIKYGMSALANQFGYQGLENPVATVTEMKVNRLGNRNTYNAYANYEILTGLNFKANLGTNNYSEKYDYYRPTSLSNGGGNAPGSPSSIAAANAVARNLTQVDKLAEFTLDYAKTFGKHNLDVLAGYSAQHTTSDLVRVTATGFTLRASWGLSGNNNIGDYNHTQTMSSPGGVVFGPGNAIATAVWAGGIKDQNLGWESTSQYNFGTDLSFFNGRLSLIANYYYSLSYNLLFNQPISAISGSSTILTNLRDSKVRNKGFDFQLDGRVVSTDNFNLGLSGNISFNSNKVLNLGGNSTIFSVGAERQYITHVTQEGQSIGMFYGYQVAGRVTPELLGKVAPSSAQSNPYKVGDLYFEDTNGDGVVNDADKKVIGNPYPDFTYGFAVNANFKSFDIRASFNGS